MSSRSRGQNPNASRMSHNLLNKRRFITPRIPFASNPNERSMGFIKQTQRWMKFLHQMVKCRKVDFSTAPRMFQDIIDKSLKIFIKHMWGERIMQGSALMLWRSQGMINGMWDACWVRVLNQIHITSNLHDIGLGDKTQGISGLGLFSTCNIH